MRLRIASALCATFLLPLLAFAGQNRPDDFVVHGTINIALGNKNGLVVLTDSMVTAGAHRLGKPGQKLFKLDDRTVCSIAGFASAAAVSGPAAPPRALPDLNTSASAIIHEYVRQSVAQSPQSIAEKLGALASLLNLHLSAIANVRDALGNATGIGSYRFQLIVAGYDADDKPKIGRITLRTKNDRGSLISEIEDASILNVESKLVWQLNGIPDVARQLLLHPESKPKDAALARYATSLGEDGGQSLTIEQMAELAKRLAYYTSEVHPEVGGPSQVATFEKQHSVSIKQPAFPEPPRPLLKFSLIIGSTFIHSGVGFEGGSAVFVRCSWAGMQQELGGRYFIANDFTDSVLMYDGGIVSFGDTNRVTNSVLVIGPHAKRDGETVRRLTKAFAWSRIVYAEPKAKP
jgi:hypothetical protein